MNLSRLLAIKVRKRVRHRACNGLYVILENWPSRHQIDDISFRGLSYHYIVNSYAPKSGICELKIVTENKSVSLDLAGKIIGDRETGMLISKNQIIKRRSIHFEKMNSSQKKAIKRIIKE